MRNRLLVSVLFFAAVHTVAQDSTVDSIQLSLMRKFNIDSAIQVLSGMNDDTAKINLLSRISWEYAFIQAEKGIYYGQKGVQLSKDLGYNRGIASCNLSIAMNYWLLGNYNNGLNTALNALHIFEDLNDQERIAWTYYITANVYRDFGDYQRALTDVHKGTILYESLGLPATVGYALTGSIYDLQNRLDSAMFYVQKAHELDLKNNAGSWGWTYYLFGNIHRKLKQYDSALIYYRAALPLVNKKDIIETYNGIAILYRETGNLDSSIYYASEVLQKWSEVSYQRGLQQAATILAENYRSINQRDSLIKYLDLSITLGNRLYNQENERDIQNLSFNEQLRRDEIMRQKQQYRDQLRLNAILGISLTLLVTAFLLWRHNRNKQKAYALLQRQKKETEEAYEQLKSAQSQLIQSEKMASLGQFTGGIAHEIQNPLNFVNNFSEVNSELIGELVNEVDKGNSEEAKAIAEDIKQNLEKINHHGKRADAIVKGMLQHSRASTGKKELTDINKLADEYLRLSYHGLRAKDKEFNAVPIAIGIKTELDESIGKIKVVPQDIGRVILNLINNAFYAVNEKQKLSANGYQPAIKVTTKKLNDRIEIKVEDNGNGIPPNIVDKIFQPFFTTKPTGEGTGLGLSLSYDIVKAHGGEINVESMEGNGSEFKILLPI